MTPAEKAKELEDNFYQLLEKHTEGEISDASKQCALLCVAEAIKSAYTISVMLERGGESKEKVFRYIDDSTITFWQEVKKEIEKL